MIFKYKIHKDIIGFSWSGKKPNGNFLGIMSPTIEDMRKTLEREFPGETIELLPE